jgi:hypothetical protein
VVLVETTQNLVEIFQIKQETLEVLEVVAPDRVWVVTAPVVKEIKDEKQTLMETGLFLGRVVVEEGPEALRPSSQIAEQPPDQEYF